MNKGQILLIELLNLININNINNIDSIKNIVIERDILLENNIISQYKNMIVKLKDFYYSDMMNCLHKNSSTKQKFTAINMLRQVLKANNFRLEPHTQSMGYDKSTGKKLVKRYFVIKEL